MTQYRIIKHPDRPLPGVEVIEHTERDSGFLLSSEFGRPDFAETVPTEPAPLTLEPKQTSKSEQRSTSILTRIFKWKNSL